MAPRDIVDSLECVLSVYFSSARHNLRAAFILCDELVEVACRAKIKQTIRNLGRMRFHQCLAHPQVGLASATHPLGNRLNASHNTRNDMQHNNPAAAVDGQHCADAIIDAVDCIEHCFPGSRPALPDKIKIAIRVMSLLSSGGNLAQRNRFEDSMLRFKWRTSKNPPRCHETTISPGMKQHWGLVVMSEYASIEQILNTIGAP